VAGGGGRRAAAQQRNGAGVHQTTRGFHQDDKHAHANTTGGFRGDRDGSTRRAVRRRGGGGSARPSQRCGAHGREQMTQFNSSPPCESPEAAHDGRETAAKRRDGADALGLGGGGAQGSEAARVSGKGPQGCGRRLK
jgi:hypothetical protein